MVITIFTVTNNVKSRDPIGSKKLTQCSSEGRRRHRSFRWGILREALVGRRSAGRPGRRPVRWAGGCSSRGWAGQRRSRGTGSPAAAAGWTPAASRRGEHRLTSICTICSVCVYTWFLHQKLGHLSTMIFIHLLPFVFQTSGPISGGETMFKRMFV